jgi:2',3'-cyclic-nucleotide 2'-phosphodiesterase (5'-nucleotidase family)
MNLKIDKSRKYIPLIFLGLFLTILPQKLNGQSLYIAYTTNLNCNLEACYCGGNQLGGMIQLIGAIDSLRTAHPELILLDSGDFMNSYPLAEGNFLMTELMKDFRYDAVGLGEQEFIEGEPFLVDAYLKTNLSLLNANLKLDSGKLKNFPPYLILNRGSKRIGIISILYPQVFDSFFSPHVVIENPENSLRNYVNQLESEVDLLVVLCHGSYDSGKNLADQFPQIDIIISGHTQVKEAVQENNQVIVQAGRDGEYIGLLTINWLNGQKEITNTFLPVDLRYGINYTMKNKIDRYYQRY